MKDLYKRLNVDESAPDEAIRAALASAAGTLDADTRHAVEFILLAPRRRAVYDRNRRVLVTIGVLRSRLALNLKPFWARGGFGDFSYPFGSTWSGGDGDGPPPPPSHPTADPLANPSLLFRAFGVRRGVRSGAGPAGARPVRGPWWVPWVAVGIAVALLALAVVFFRG